VDRLHLVAVYGTLKRGQVNHRMLEMGGAESAGEGTVAGVLYDLGWYPGLRDEPGGRAEVELYRVDDRLLTVLDRLEAYDPNDEDGSEYLRRWVGVRLADGSETEAWVYRYVGSMIRARRLRGPRWPEPPADDLGP
jgi:gamma-glutamylcyclotransferase (GGCT)/AIG2-like uncharacterized protein YtfP